MVARCNNREIAIDRVAAPKTSVYCRNVNLDRGNLTSKHHIIPKITFWWIKIQDLITAKAGKSISCTAMKLTEVYTQEDQAK